MSAHRHNYHACTKLPLIGRPAQIRVVRYVQLRRSTVRQYAQGHLFDRRQLDKKCPARPVRGLLSVIASHSGATA